MPKSQVENVFHGLIAGAAIAVAASMVKREFFRHDATGEVTPHKVEAWAEVSNGNLSRGPSNAPVTIVEFADFECPACRSAAPMIERVRNKFPAAVRVVFRHFPLSYHRNAATAALAAECAAKQGAFWSMHDKLYAHQAQLGQESFASMAKDAGVQDSFGFTNCMRMATDSATVNADAALAGKIGAIGTPTFVINGMMYPRPPSEAELEAIVAPRAVAQ